MTIPVFIYRNQCEVCGSGEKSILLSKPFLDSAISDFIVSYYQQRVPIDSLVGMLYELAQCKHCRFIWQTYILNEGYMGVLYSKWISAQESLDKKKNATIDFYAHYASEVYIISSLLNKKPYQVKILDYGMGWGYWALMAKAFGYDVYGLELAQDRVEFARSHGIKTIDPEKASTMFFDFINAEQVFEHISPPLKYLQKLTQWLTPNGILRIATPDASTKIASLSDTHWKASKDVFHPLEHINAFTHHSLCKLANQAGLQVIPNPILPSFHPSLKTWLRYRILKKSNYISTSTKLYFVKQQKQ